MAKLKYSLVYIAILASSVGGTAYGQDDVLGELPGSKGDTVCCISVDVPTLERARELSALGIGSGNVGTTAIPFSDSLFVQLKDRAFDVVLTCFELVDQAILGKGIWRTHLGLRSRTEPARPVLARFKEEVLGKEPDWRIVFLNKDLTAITTEQYGDAVTISKHAQYVGIYRQDVDSRQKPVGKWDVFHRSGQRRGGVDVSVVYDVAPSWILLSDAGNWAQFNQLHELEVLFYEKGGELLKKIQVREEDVFLLEAHADFSSDGQYLALQVLGNAQRQDGSRPINEVMVFSSEGKEIWRFVPDEQLNIHSCISIAENASYVISSFQGRDHASNRFSKSVTYLLNKQGGVIRKISDFSPSRVKFSSSRKYAVLFDPGEGIRLLELPSGRTVFHYDSNAPLRDFDLTESGELIGVLGHRRILVLDFAGKMLWNLYLPRLGPASVNHRISLSEDGKEMSLTEGNEFHVYRRVQFELRD